MSNLIEISAYKMHISVIKMQIALIQIRISLFNKQIQLSTHIFFSKKFQHICVSLDVNFNESLTNDIVSFEQLGPVFKIRYLYLNTDICILNMDICIKLV